MNFRNIRVDAAAPLVNDVLKKRYQVFVSSTYSDLIEEWASGRYHPMLFTRTLIEEATVERIRLVPAAPISAVSQGSSSGRKQ